QAALRLPDDDGTQLRRGTAHDRLAAADRQAEGRNPGQLAARRRRHHRRLRLERRGEGTLRRLEVAEAVHPDRAAASGEDGRSGLSLALPALKRSLDGQRAQWERALSKRSDRFGE